MKSLVKKKGCEATDETSKTFIMSLFEDEDKKAITASVLSAKVKETKTKHALSLEALVRQAVTIKKEQVAKRLIGTAPYNAPKMQ
eukprot:2764557-Ditylum_brightwellii.AAC.1